MIDFFNHYHTIITTILSTCIIPGILWVRKLYKRNCVLKKQLDSANQSLVEAKYESNINALSESILEMENTIKEVVAEFRSAVQEFKSITNTQSEHNNRVFQDLYGRIEDTDHIVDAMAAQHAVNHKVILPARKHIRIPS